ncbi:MAG TPA: hypothetical protein VH639_04255 [Bryobacteraceae bacterium]
MRTIGLAVFLAASAAAQWINLPTPGIPRTPDGKPDLKAPAPKTSAGKPDFSGMWIPREILPCNAGERGVQCTELPLTPQLINFAAGLQGGLPYQPWAAGLVKGRAKEVAFLDPHMRCLPPNFPRAWAFPETEKIFQTPTQLVILHEYNASYRQIFFDGRSLPPDMLPTWNGYSIAHWEGETLVVDSAGYRDDSWLDTAGNFFSSSARVTERIRRPSFGALDVDVTVDDPKVFTKPWTVALHMKPLLDTEMIDFICLENNKDIEHLVH